MGFVRPMSLALLFAFDASMAGFAADFALAVSGAANMQISEATGYGPKGQLGGEAALDLVFTVAPWLGIGPAAGVLGAAASNLEGGFGYRSYLGGFLGVAAVAYAPIAGWPRVGTLFAGGRLAVLANIATYRGTGLAFFFPGIGLDGILALAPTGVPFLRFALAFPLRVQFRRDLRYSGSAGIGLDVSYERAAAARTPSPRGAGP